MKNKITQQGGGIPCVINENCESLINAMPQVDLIEALIDAKIRQADYDKSYTCSLGNLGEVEEAKAKLADFLGVIK